MEKGGYRQRPPKVHDSDQRGQRGPSIKRADRQPMLHRNITSANHSGEITVGPGHVQYVIAIDLIAISHWNISTEQGQ